MPSTAKGATQATFPTIVTLAFPGACMRRAPPSQERQAGEQRAWRREHSALEALMQEVEAKKDKRTRRLEQRQQQQEQQLEEVEEGGREDPEGQAEAAARSRGGAE